MTLRTQLTHLLLVSGCGLLAMGFWLDVLFAGIDISPEGFPGIAVAALLEAGLCLLLFTWIRGLVPVSGLLRSDGAELSDEQRLNRLGERSLRRAKLTVLFSVASNMLAFALYILGVAVAFANFNFASGTNDVGFIIILAGFAVGVIAVIGNLRAGDPARG